MLKKLKQYKFIILVFLISLISTLGFLHDGFPSTDDGNWMIIRLSAFFESLKAGQIPVRFLLRLNNGFGYPVADFLYPLFLYIGSAIHILGFNFVNTIKIILGLSLVGSSLFSYLWLNKKFSNLSSFIGALVFTFSPYLLFDVYKRGSVGEVLAIAILPFVLWQIERKSIIFTSIGISFLILSHNTLSVFFLPLILIYVLLLKPVNVRFLVMPLVLGILGAAFFWLPALYDSSYTVFSSTGVSQFYNYFLTPKDYNLFGFISLLSIISFILIFKFRQKKDLFFIFSAVVSIFIIILNLPLSKPLWELIPFKHLIQFPFRLISIYIVLIAFQAAFITDKFKARKQIITFLIIAFLVIISAMPFLTNIKYENYPDSYYSTNLATTTVKNEYMPKWVKTLPTEFPYKRVFLNGNEKINLFSVSDKKIKFQVYLASAKAVYVNVIYFPGWQAYINGNKGIINYSNPGGLISVNLDKGQNEVLIVFEETPLRIFADFLSIIGLLGLGAVLFMQIYNKKNK